MLVHKPSRKLILNLREPARVTGVIPTAKVVAHGGTTLVVVPHREDEVRVLRNLGFDAPAPIEHYYDWPCAYPSGPFIHQRLTAAFMTINPKGYILNGMGSGKTLAALWAFDYLRSRGLAKRMLVLAPLSTLERTWGDEIFTHFPHLSAAVLHGTMERRTKLLAVEHDVYIVNHDGVKSAELLDALVRRRDIDALLIDEVAVCRTQGTLRYKAVLKLAEKRTYVWGMTGTPTPNAPTDAWAQCRLITPHTVPRFFGTFRDSVMKQISPYKWVPRPDALDKVRAAMQPAIRFSREECIDLPPTTYQTREVELTREQKKAYNDMLRQLKAEYEGGQIMAVNEAVKLSKLLQIVTGVAYGIDGGEVVLPSGPRVEVVREIIEEAEAKVIVFVPFTKALLHLAQELRKTFSVECVYGEVSKNERDRIFSDFQKRADPRVLVADARTMSHGLTLTASNTIVWYGPTTSNETWNQANARIVRPGQTRNTLIVRIESTPVERVVYDRLEKRTAVQGVLLDMLKEVSFT
jgi:SNF2 family DNA or RNA helicase